MNTFDPRIIDHTNEDLMRYYFVRLADEAGMLRRPAEVLFRDTWHVLSRKLSADREDTFRIMRNHLREAM
jgi:hypothetical protein